MSDRSRPLVHDVCAVCFHADPQDLSLRYIPCNCRSPGSHRSAAKVPVTCYEGVLVREPPFDHVLAEIRGWFTKCKFGQQCGRGGLCSFPHSEKERKYWNEALSRFRSTGGFSLTERHIPRQRMVPQFHPQPLLFQPHSSLIGPPLVSPQPSIYPRPFIHPAVQIPLQVFQQQSPAAPHNDQWPLNPHHQQLRSAEPRHAPPTTSRPRSQQPPSEADMIRDAAIPLTRESYKRKFTALLYLEEDVHDKLLKEKCNGVYQLNVKPRERAPRGLQQRMVEHARYASIYGMTGDQMMYAAQASEGVFISDPSNERRVATAEILSGGIFHSLSDKLFIGFTQSEAFKLESYFLMQDGWERHSVYAQFEVKHSYFQMLRRSLNNLSDDAIERIMPAGGDFANGLDLTRVPFPKEYESLNLDKKQFRALQLILFSRSRAPVIIPGPFGTGKTRVLAVATHNFIETAKKSSSIARVLVCCHHQVSADTFVESYFGRMSTDKYKSWGVKLVRLTRNRYYLESSEYKRYYVPLYEFKHQVKEYSRFELLVMVTTFSTALNIVSLLGDQFFTHILLDEGAQVREPEAVAPLCMANKDTKIVIAGDPQQVGPAILVLGDRPQQHGLGVSLLERLLKAYKEAGGNNADYIAHLPTNHRCHKDILELPSRLFYGSSLVPMSSAHTVPGAPYPLVFVCSSIAHPQPTEEDTNHKEAKLLVEQFRQFCKKGDTRSFQLGTCFMALSRRQVTVLQKDSLSKQETALVKLFPSYEIQGREFKALFISTMECVQDGFQSANPTKSFCNRYVFNTALTRAQSLVVCAGNPFQLLKVEAAMADHVGCWREYLRRCIEKGTFIVPDGVGNSDSVIARLRQLIDIGVTFTPVQVPPLTQMEDKMKAAANEINERLRANPLTKAKSPKRKKKLATAKQEKKLVSSPQPPPVLTTTNPQPIPPVSRSSRATAMASKQTTHPSLQPNTNPPSITSTGGPSSRAMSSIQTTPQPAANQRQIPSLFSSATSSSSQTTAMSSKHTTHSSLQPATNQRQTPSISPASSSSQTTAKSSKQTTHSPLQPATKPSTKSSDASTNRKGSHSGPQSSHYQSAGSKSAAAAPIYLSESEYPSLDQSLKQAPPTKKNQVPPREINPPPSLLSQPSAVHHQPAQPRRPPMVHQGQTMPFRQISRHKLDHVHRPRDEELLSIDHVLTQENYKEKFHQLLCREEEEHKKILHERCDGVYNLTINQHGTPFPGFKVEEPFGGVRYGFISADHLDGDKIAYAEQSSDGNLLISCSGKEVSATTIRVYFEPKKEEKGERIHVWITEADATKLPCFDKYHKFNVPSVDVKFELKWSYFHRLHKALDLLSLSTIKRLVPISIPQRECSLENYRKVGIRDNLPTIFRDKLYLDSQQTNALHIIVNATPEVPAIVVGSFGTGKTRLLARAAFEFLKYRRQQPQPRVLVCAHHQPSAGSFLTNYFGPLLYSGWEVQNIARMIIRTSDRHDDKPETYPEFCFTAHEIDFRNVQLVITTFGNVLHLQDKQDKVYPGYFTHILIDEGAQTREPENIIPLWLCGPNTVVAIAGDHKQVGPSILVLGEEARDRGLKVSLLERLHAIYSKKNTSHLCATLLTNHRCHPALLALPSYLFYESALINSDSQEQPKLHPSTSFPLHFICSSLDTDLEVKDSTNPYEADLLLAEAAKYVKKWPNDWDGKYEQPVCIMSTTANQQRVIRDKLKTKDYKYVLRRDTVDTLTVFTMQGCQFQCLFLSTSEPTFADGKSKNSTKTPCSQYVFNTALTRAKSLVVCAGNPFLLMKIEEKVGNKDKRPFWAEYIRQCWENDTFKTPDSLHLSSEVRKDKLKKLRELIFTSDTPSSNKDPDSITEAYRKNYEMKLRYTKGGLRWRIKAENVDEMEESSSDVEFSYKNAFLCNLEIVNRHKALGHPLSSKNPLVTLNGLDNRRCALDGDRVFVDLYPTYEGSDKRYGKVVKVHEKCHQKKYVCRVARNSTIHFHPTDKKTPTFVTLPKLSQAMLKYSKEDIEAGLKSQMQWVVVFEENSLRDKVPKIKAIIPAEVAHRLLFVVKEVRWHPKYRLPLGAVVESLPLGTNFFHAERLLRATYNTEKDDQDIELCEKKENELSDQEDLPPNAVSQAFTIDPSDARNLDDALSLVHESDDTYTMAILISNVGRQLEQGTKFDKRAKNRGNSVYGFFRNMIPAAICQQYSLNPNKVRDVIIVSTKVTLHDGTVSIDTASTTIREGKLRSQVQLDYVQAQQLLGEQPYPISLEQKIKQYQCSSGQPNLTQSIKLLYKIAVHRRKQRLGRAAFASNISEEDEDDGNESWQAHLMVKELMIWANSTIAEHVQKHRPNCAVLRRQAAPDLQEVKEVKRQHCAVLQLSVALSALMTSSDSLKPREPLLIPHLTLLELKEAIESENILKLQRLLTSDYLYPQLAVAEGHLRRISQRAEYVCSDLPITDSRSPFRHHSLCLDYYTHFTSPIRRYCDVVVQRLLLSILNPGEYSAEQQKKYTPEKLKELCLHLNIRLREAKKYQREYDQLVSAQQFGESCKEALGYVSRIDGWFVVNFPEAKYRSCLKRENAEFHVSALVCKERDGLLKWNVSMFSFNGNQFILDNARLCQFIVADSGKTSVSTKTKATTKDCDSSPAEHSTVNMTVFYLPHDSQADPKVSTEDLSLDHKDVLFKLQLCATQTQEVVAVNPELWQSVIEKVDNLTEDTIQKLSAALHEPDQPQEQDGQQVRNHPDTVERFQTSPILKYEVACKLGSNSIVPVWLGQTLLREPVISPCLQLIEVAPELRICLQHNKHPADCFSDTQIEQASRRNYESLDDYIKLWEKVFLAEAAENSVISRDKQLTFLKDVPLQWPKLTMPETSTEDYVVPQGHVTLTIPPESNHFLHYNIKINPGDLVCVRYSVKDCKAVYHLVIKKVYEDDEGKKIMGKKRKGDLPLVIEMENISRNSCQVSSKMAEILKQTPPPPCELQIINLQESYNRVYKVLVSLKDHKMRHSNEQQAKQQKVEELRLVRLIAMGETEAIYKRNKTSKKELEAWETILRKDKMAHTLWTDDSIELNEVQMKAIRQALTSKFQLIQGPPGSGKSETGAHIAYIFAQRNHSHQCVVYCAPSNKAVDVVHGKLIDANKKLLPGRQLKLLRLYGRTHERMDYPGPHSSDGFLQSAEGEGRCQVEFRDYALHHLIRKDCPKLARMEAKFEKMQKDVVPSPQLLAKYKEVIKEREMEVIGKEYHIILATCNECAGGRLSDLRGTERKGAERTATERIGIERIAQVIVDECGMAHEPETIAAVSLSNHVVLIGDHKQLQPVIKYNAARENGLSTSLFQRYAEKIQKFLITLKFQYRMHAKICEFPSDYFYEGKLKPDSIVERRLAPPDMIKFWHQNGLRWPIAFCNIVGKEAEASSISGHHRKGRKTDPHSKCNPIEAAKAVDIALALQKRLGGAQATIAILTPYRAQKDQVLSLMEGNPIAAVVTINESQGDEYDYVILTTVRSLPYNDIRNSDLVQPDKKWLRDNLGFLTDEHQVNVAITRAKQGLIIVGNRTLLEYDKDTWEPLIEFYHKNECVVRGEQFPR